MSLFGKILAIARCTLLEAWRSRFFFLSVLTACLLLGLSFFLRRVSITESLQAQSGFLAASARVSAVFILCAFISASQSREFSDKGLEYWLALPMPRYGYFFGKILAYGICALWLALLFCSFLLWQAPPAPVFYWGASFFMELLLMSATSLFFALTLTHTFLSLSSILAFYFFSRSIAALQWMDKNSIMGSDFFQNMILDGVSLFFPRLDAFTRTEWIVYHAPSLSDFFMIIAQGLVYLLFVSSAALFDLYRKNV